jgi:hypothetical protein
MRRILAMILLSVFVGAAATAADNPAVGTWQCAFLIQGGDDMLCTLKITEEAGKLTGAMMGGAAELPLTDVKLDGDSLSFKFTGSGDVCAIEVKITGKKLAGKWSSGGQEGTFQGQKQS